MKALRAIAVCLLLAAALHSAGQSFFRVAVGGIGLLFVGATAPEKTTTDADQKFEETYAEPRAHAQIDLVVGLGFGLLTVLELACAVLVGIGKPSGATVVLGLLSLAGAGFRASQIPIEREQAEHQREAALARAQRHTGDQPTVKEPPRFYGIGVSGKADDYVLSIAHASAGGLAVGIGLVLSKRRRGVVSPA